MSTLHYVLSFLLAIAILVAVHEYGHFIVARLCGIRVLRFSLGFGPQLFSVRFGAERTEFSLAAIPLGGYVRMLDEREAPVEASERHRAFNTQSLMKRSLVVLAGPLANLLLAILLYWGLGLAGTRDFPARLGNVPEGSPAAQAGLQAGDTIRAFAGNEVKGWTDLRWQVVRHALDDSYVDLEVQQGEMEPRKTRILLSGLQIEEKAADPLQQIGLVLPAARISPVLSRPLPGSPAELAGLQENDFVRSVDGKPIAFWADFVKLVSASPGKSLHVLIDRSGRELEIVVVPERVAGDVPRGRVGVAVKIDPDALNRDTIIVRHGIFDGLAHAIEQTWTTSTFSLKVMWNIVTGRLSVRNISGPVTIADYAGQSASAGLEPYLKFLAMVSISLGILNLLPVPVLDGGHLLYHAIEYVRGRPISEAGEVFGQRLGMVFLALLMSLAFFNDINRILFG
ncbi:RIP metalloprotease RseP [Uliginosibacterium paludis]|uniref:Zinc metalloprotease n=1 Tax=Uliginosibacterium paludis TaxID=1615952 RepID=A0ABV2CKF9_9RHOO